MTFSQILKQSILMILMSVGAMASYAEKAPAIDFKKILNDAGQTAETRLNDASQKGVHDLINGLTGQDSNKNQQQNPSQPNQQPPSSQPNQQQNPSSQPDEQ